MKKRNLFKVEIYRFFHSMSIIKYLFLISLMLFFISYINIAYLGSEITAKLAWASIAADFPYLLALICTVIAVYVGREFHQKTINYEIMGGYNFWRIAVSKTVTCGIIVSGIILICMITYLGMLPSAFYKGVWGRVICMYILLFHLCACTVLYVMLCRNAVVGGAVAYAKYFVIEAAIHLVTDNAGVNGLLVFNQWYELISVENPLTTELVLGIVAAAIVEYGVLQGALALCSKLMDV